jgi:phosphoglycolate phosphatase-like HAD superfamily hydrolase
VTLVLLDVDGTLVDASGAGRWALERAFETVFGAEGISAVTARVRFQGRTDPSIIAEIAARAGIPEARLSESARPFEETYLAFLEERLGRSGGARALPGARDLLAALERGAIPFGLLTGNIERGARLKLLAAGIANRFPAGAYGSDGADRDALGRIARERFESILGRGVPPREVVVVGDSPEDVRAARANGYRSLAVATGWTAAADLEAERPDAVLADLSATGSVLAWIAAGA